MGSKKLQTSSDNPIQRWGNNIKWEKRTKAVCKPCWELKYCPYGILVEDFPIKKDSDDKSCRIYGHDCPVFYTNEPFTETKELRNISRSIPRKVQFQVLKRDNQICSDCGQSVKEEDIEFDHIIPWAKGGPSEEHNVKLLCRKCNRKKGAKFEDTHLVQSLADHLSQSKKPIPFVFVQSIFTIMRLIWDNYSLIDAKITPESFCRLFGRRKVTEEDKLGAEMFNDLTYFFLTDKPTEIKQYEFEAMKYRWGYLDKIFHSIHETAAHSKITEENIFKLDLMLIERLGFFVRINEVDQKRWMKT